MSIFRDLARALDPLQIMRDLRLPPDPWQARLIESDARRVLVRCGRQVGKSTGVRVVTMNEATNNPGSLSLIVAPSQRQSVEQLRGITASFWQIGNALSRGAEPGPDADLLSEDDVSKLKIELKNGSRILALPGSGATIRGFASVSLVVVEECGHVPDDLIAAIRPMLAVSRGRIIALGTPNGKIGWMWNTWSSNQKWDRYHVPSSACSRITKEFLREELEAMGPLMYSQEYDAEFIDSNTSVFPQSLIQGVLVNDADFDRPSLE
jgi:hypothetical protein